MEDSTQTQLTCPNINCSRTFFSIAEIEAHLNDIIDPCKPPQPSFEFNHPSPASHDPAHRTTDSTSSASRSAFGTGPTRRTYLYHPKSGWIYGRGANTLEKMEEDRFNYRREHNVYYPFQDREEFELAKWLEESSLNQEEKTEFLHTRYTQKNKPSFSSAAKLRSWIEDLPDRPRWKASTLEIEGYRSAKPLVLFWRDGLEVVESIFGNPIFANNISYDPVKVWIDAAQTQREYTGFFTADFSWTCQDLLPEGATICGVICASDKTQLTVGTGGLHLHPMFITIANIDGDVRMKTSSHAWECVAYLPIIDAATFPMHSDFTSILHDRMWHAAVEKVVASLKVAAQYGRLMADPRGDLRLAHTLLVGWIADLPEQLLISAVSGSQSPSSMATTKEFGDGKVYPPRTGQDTLSKIRELYVVKNIDPWDIPKWLRASKAAGLNGVHQPFWRDWPFADPSRFLTPEILHTIHKFFFDHPLNWCKVRVGNPELDSRFTSMHRRVGFRHFTSGICRVKQLTGREHRDIQRTIVPAIYGAVEPDFVSAMSALIDFIYQAQAPAFTDASIEEMVRSLDVFHSNKEIFLSSGSRAGKKEAMDHFNIPKMGLFPGFAFAIREMGAIFQYSADVSEKLLGTDGKKPFRFTNHKDFEEQCIRYLDRRDKLRFFHFFTTLKFNGASLHNDISVARSPTTTLHPASEWISRVVPGEDKRLGAPRSIRNFFREQDNIDAQIAHHVTKRPDLLAATIAEIAQMYGLPDLPAAMIDYTRDAAFDDRLQPRYLEDNYLPINLVDLHVWYKFKIQHLASQQPNLILPAQTVKAQPPSISYPWGYCDAVRCELLDGQRNQFFIGQVRLVFQATIQLQSGGNPITTPVLLYVQTFRSLYGKDTNGALVPEQTTGLCVLEREIRPVQIARIVQGPVSANDVMRTGVIVPPTNTSLAVDLQPVHGKQKDPLLAEATAMERPAYFFLNKWSDKEVYYTLRSGLA